MSMEELEKLAGELANVAMQRKLVLEHFDLEVALERADSEELRDEIASIIRRNAKQVYYDDEYAVFATTVKYYYTPSRAAQKYYDARAGERKYQAVWIFGLDSTQRSGFWIHRLRWHDEFEELAKNEWKGMSKEKIRDWMGFSKSAEEAWTAKVGEWVRVSGDVRMSMIEGWDQILSRAVEDQIDSAIDTKYSEVFESQSASEEEIMAYQQEQGWKVLSAKRRAKAENDIKRKKAYAIASAEISKIRESIVARAKSEVEREWREMREVSVRIGRHVLSFEHAEETIALVSGAAWGLLVVAHPEHGVRRFILPNGRYEIALLERHVTQLRY